MRLEELLVITSDATTLNVIDYETSAVIGRYDGKDSIDKKLNSRMVIKLYVKADELYVEVIKERIY